MKFSRIRYRCNNLFSALHVVLLFCHLDFVQNFTKTKLVFPPAKNHLQERTYLCILATNVATEKVFIFLWFWWVVQIWISMCQIFSCISSGISFWSRSASVPSYTMRFCFYPGKYHFFPSDHNNDVWYVWTQGWGLEDLLPEDHAPKGWGRFFNVSMKINFWPLLSASKREWSTTMSAAGLITSRRCHQVISR